MANKQQTAVETLIEQLLQIRDTIGMNTKQNRFARGRVVDCIIKAREALQMERQQIKDAWINAWKDSMLEPLDDKFYEPEADEYYNETFSKH